MLCVVRTRTPPPTHPTHAPRAHTPLTPRAQTLVDAVVHAVNEDYKSMAEDFIKLGFLAPGGAGGGASTRACMHVHLCCPPAA